MTSWKNGYYSVVQYCPDRSRLEAANVGVLLFCPELKYIDARTAVGNDRVRRFFGADSVNVASLDAAKRAIQNRVRAAQGLFGTIDDLVTFIDSRANEIVLTSPRSVKVNAHHPDRTLQSLFDELVGGRAKKQTVAQRFPELDELFRRESLRGRVQFDKQIRVPVVERPLKAPYAFVNGALNLVLAERFPESEINATSLALRLAAEGDLLQKHPLDDGTQAQLIVASRFEHQDDLKRRIFSVFREYNVRAFDVASRTDLRKLADDVEREAHG